MKQAHIEGLVYMILECDFRNERDDKGVSEVHPCERVGVTSYGRGAYKTYRQTMSAAEFNDVDATEHTDTEGRIWVLSELGFNCPGCLAFAGDFAPAPEEEIFEILFSERRTVQIKAESKDQAEEIFNNGDWDSSDYVNGSTELIRVAKADS